MDGNQKSEVVQLAGMSLADLLRIVAASRPRPALDTGQLNEWRAALLMRETTRLATADRAAVDEELAADTGALRNAGDRAIIAATRAAAYRRDPRSVTGRAATRTPPVPPAMRGAAGSL